MKTVAELKAEQAAAIAKLETEIAIANLCPLPPLRVMTTKGLGEKSWITYEAATLWAALDIMAAFEPIACHKFKGTYTRYEPAEVNAARTKDKGEDKGGPYVATIKADNGSGYSSAQFAFFVRLGGDIHQVHVNLVDGYRSIGSYGAQFVPSPSGRSRQNDGSRFISGNFNPNSRVSCMADNFTQWGAGSNESASYTYAFGADDVDDETGIADYQIDAIYRLENLAGQMHGERK